MPQLLETKARTTVESKQMARSMLMRQYMLFVHPNLNAYVEGASTLSQKCIGNVIDNLQEAFFPEESPAVSKNGMIQVNITEHTEVIDVGNDVQSASGRAARKSTNTTTFGPGLDLLKIYLCVHRKCIKRFLRR